MLFQIVGQKVDSAAFSRPVANEDDLRRVDEIPRYLLVVGRLLRDSIALVMCLFTVNQMTMKSIWIIGPHGRLFFRDAFPEILIETRNMMVDHNDHTARMARLARLRMKPGFVQELSKPGDFLRTQLAMIRAHEEGTLRFEYERELVRAVRLDFANLTD